MVEALAAQRLARAADREALIFWIVMYSLCGCLYLVGWWILVHLSTVAGVIFLFYVTGVTGQFTYVLLTLRNPAIQSSVKGFLSHHGKRASYKQYLEYTRVHGYTACPEDAFKTCLATWPDEGSPV